VDLARSREIFQKFVYDLENYDGAEAVLAAVKNVKLPADRPALLEQAKRNKAPDYVQQILQRFSERKYAKIEDVAHAAALDPLGRRLFKKGGLSVKRTLAETDRKKEFEITLELNEE